MHHLAINGGSKLREKYFPSQYRFREDKKKYLKSIEEIFDRGILSAFRGNAGPNFWGGEIVQRFEKMFGDKFTINSLAVNSCTSALWAACAAIDLKPGDEVIVTPWSMCCSATVPLLFGAIPVFADIDPNTFCLDPESIRKKITDKTKAIIVVDLFGGLADWERINKIAKENNLYTIEDAAQAIGAYKIVNRKEGNRYAGSFGDIGCFSFTQGKHLTAGEGGMVCSNNVDLHYRLSLVRNHAESVISDMLYKELTPTINYEKYSGLNLRMTELQAAIMIEQLQGLDKEIEKRRYNAKFIEKQIGMLPFIRVIECDHYHSYYVLPFLYIGEPGLPHRDKFIQVIQAELSEEEGRPDRGIPIASGYIRPLYMMPLFQKQSHWAFHNTKKKYVYKEGDCPNCERLQNHKLFLTLYHGLNLKSKDREDICNAFFKAVRWMGEIQ